MMFTCSMKTMGYTSKKKLYLGQGLGSLEACSDLLQYSIRYGDPQRSALDDGFIYNVTTRDGDYKGKCVKDMDYGGNGTTAKCDMWIGEYFFRTVLRCESDICT